MDGTRGEDEEAPLCNELFAALLEATELRLLKKDEPKGPIRGLVPILKA